MSAVATAHPAGLPGSPRLLFVGSLAAKIAAGGALIAACVVLYSEAPIMRAVALSGASGLFLLCSWLMRERSWALTPSDAETYRTPTWVIVVNEIMGLLGVLALPGGMAAIGSVLGFVVALIVLFATTGRAIVMAVRSRSELRTVRSVRAVAIAAIAVGTVAATVIAGGGIAALTVESTSLGAIALAVAGAAGGFVTGVWR